MQDFETRRKVLLRVEPHDESQASRRALDLELDPAHEAAWLFDDPGRAWHARKSADGSELSVRVVETGVWPLQRKTVTLPETLAEARPFTTVTVGNIGLPEEWRGRVYLFDAANADN